MSLSTALWIAGAVTLLVTVFIGEKIIDLDFSGLQPQNRKKAKRARLLAARATPLEGTHLRREMKTAFEDMLLPFAKTDKTLLPPRMDKAFRHSALQQLELLERRQLCREILLTDVTAEPENDFTRWNDDGREWREGVLHATALERLVSWHDGRPVYQRYRKNACLRVLQSRHIRTSDRDGQKKSYYADRLKIHCPSCGGAVELNTQQVACPYCGAVIRSDFYDWQTEDFEIYEKPGANLQRFLYLLAAGAVLFLCVFLCLYLIPDTEISLSAGVGAAVFVWVMVVILNSCREHKQNKLAGQIVRYSENYLRACINEALYKDNTDETLLDHGIDTVLLKSVRNTGKTTELTAELRISETYLPAGKKPYTTRQKRTVTLQRARHPERRKTDGEFFTEKECPSCGANFIPDENHCCSYCGYGLQVNNAKWVLVSPKQ